MSMNLTSIPALSLPRWAIKRVALFALLGLLALDGGPFIASAFAFQLSPSSLTFTAVQNGANPAPQSISISKFGGRTKTWTASLNASWLTASPTSGTISTATVSITTSVTISGLAVGTYNSSMTVTVAGTAKTIPVTLTITSATLAPVIGLNPTSLSFGGTAGGSNPAAQTLAISNVGGGTLTWNTSSNATWLALSPLSGTNTGSITASVNLAGLLAGTYTATVTVAATGATTKTLPVTLTVSAATTTGTAGLTWNANTETDLAGYKVYQATSSGAYGAPIATIPNTTTSYTVSGLQTGTTYFFIITAYDSAGNESLHSSEVSKSIY